MDAFESMKAVGELWGRGAQSLLQAQREMMDAAIAAMPAEPAAQGDGASLREAQAAFAQAWAGAQEIVAAAMAGRPEAPGPAAQGRTDPVAAQVLARAFDPRSWLAVPNGIDESLNRLAQGPQLADLWTAERKFAALFAAWTALRRHTIEHNTITLDAWAMATSAFAQAVDARAAAGEPPGSGRALPILWIETANDVLLETQRSEPFLRSQRDTLKAATDLRLAQREVAEAFVEFYDLPSRSEIDDVHRGLTDLRREMRALRRAARTRRTAGAGPRETNRSERREAAGGEPTVAELEGRMP